MKKSNPGSPADHTFTAQTRLPTLDYAKPQPYLTYTKLPTLSPTPKSKKKYYLALIFALSLIQWLANNLINQYTKYTEIPFNFTFQSLSIGFLIATFIFLFLSLSKFADKPCYKVILPSLASLCLSITFFTHRYSHISKALEKQTFPAYHSILFNFVCVIGDTLISDALFQVWPLKAFPTLANLAALVLAFNFSNHSQIGFYWINVGCAFFSVIILFFIKANLAEKDSTKLSELKNSSLYQQTLNQIPSAVAIIGKENCIEYSNFEYKRLNARYEQNLLEKIESVRSNPQDTNEGNYFTNRPSWQKFDMTESHVLPKHFEEDNFDHSLQDNGPRTQTLCCYNNLLDVIKILTEAKCDNPNLLTSPKTDNVFYFEGKLLNTNGPSSSWATLDIKLCKLAQTNKILLIITESTSRDTIASLESSNEYKDKILATVSHEMRTPLGGNMGLIEAAMGEEDLPGHIRERFLAPALQSGQLLYHLVNDILDIAQIKTNKLRITPTRLSLKTTLENCCQLLELKAQTQNVKLVLDLDPDLPEFFFIDHNRLTQIILNLLSNALKFTFEGEVRLIARVIGPTMIEISINDSGVGMSQQDVSRLFTQFTRLSNFGKRKNMNPTGVGLGLSIANSLAKALGSARSKGIKVESSPDHGSKFSFVIQEGRAEEEEDDGTGGDTERPLNLQANESCKVSVRRSMFSAEVLFSPTTIAADERTGLEGFEEQQDIHKPYESPSPKKLRKLANNSVLSGTPEESKLKKLIKRSYRHLVKKKSQEGQLTALVVDDEPFNILALETLLNKFGIKVESAYNGKDAVEKILRKSKESSLGDYNLIFMDCQMPILDGYEATEILKKMYVNEEVKEVPIIGCSGYQSSEHINKCLECGMSEVILKPVLKESVGEILKKYVKDSETKN